MKKPFRKSYVVALAAISVSALLGGCSAPQTSASDPGVSASDSNSSSSLKSETTSDNSNHDLAQDVITVRKVGYTVTLLSDDTVEDYMTNDARKISLDLAGQMNEAIRDSDLRKLKPLPENETNCLDNGMDISFAVQEWSTPDKEAIFMPCKYEGGMSDPLTQAAQVFVDEAPKVEK